MNAPTLLGHVGAVSGAKLSIRQFQGIASGIAIIGGRSYRVGQVGSFVRIPQGYHDLYGIISDVGASATPDVLKDAAARGERWMTVQLVGEIVEASFERGVSQYPSINDEVHLVTETDLEKIYGTSDAGQVTIGRLAAAESIPVRIDLDKLLTRHSAVLGSTGSGKSTTVASLLRSIPILQRAGVPARTDDVSRFRRQVLQRGNQKRLPLFEGVDGYLARSTVRWRQLRCLVPAARQPLKGG